MKSILLGLFSLGVLSLVFAQEPEFKVEVIELKEIVLRPPNFEYLASVRALKSPATVKVLETKGSILRRTGIKNL